MKERENQMNYTTINKFADLKDNEKTANHNAQV
jgi:hypothetical protein